MLPKTWITSFNPASTDPTSPTITTEPLNLSTKPNAIPADLFATSAAIIAPSLGVIVRIPIASFFSITSPSFLYISSLGLAIICARVTCLPGTYSWIILCFSSLITLPPSS